MKNWTQIFRKNTGLSPYVWIVFYILPFYFIVQSSSTPRIVFGIMMIIVFFACYFLAFVSKGWLVYFWTSVQIAISILMSLLFAYVYFSLFLAFFIGHLKNRAAFFILYVIHIVATFATINYGLVTQKSVFLTQLPFVFLSLVAVILLPVSTYNKNKEDKLQGQLENANKRISELVKLEERQRISRDLHDTLGQKLSLIGLKSDLAGKLILKNPTQARIEINDVQQTARIALKEVRELVTQMRGSNLEDEMNRIRQILGAAQIDLTLRGDPKLMATSLIAENVISMCLKEAVTNVVKHSGASSCAITIEQSPTELAVSLQDDGVGMAEPFDNLVGNGLRGMKERLEFVNGSLEFMSGSSGGRARDDDRDAGEIKGTRIVMRVPNVSKPVEEEVSV